MSQDSQSEVLFWRDNFDDSGYPIWSPSPKVEVLTYADASGEGWGGVAVKFSDKVGTGCWSSADCTKSSTLRDSDSSPSCLLSLVAQVRIICGSDHSAVIPCLVVGIMNYVSFRYRCMWLSRIMLSVVTMY